MTDVLTGRGGDTQNNREGYRQRLMSGSHKPRTSQGHRKLEGARKDSLPSRVVRGQHLDCELLASNTVRIDLYGFTVWLSVTCALGSEHENQCPACSLRPADLVVFSTVGSAQRLWVLDWGR